MLDAFKKYPSQISSAFRRFPVASAFALFTFFSLVVDTEFFEYIDIAVGSPIAKFIIWSGIYPIAAILISLTTSLVQESLNKRSNVPQIVASAAWLIISTALVYFGFTDYQPDLFSNEFVPNTIFFIYVAVFLGLFIAPFWKQKDENAFWIFTFKNIKALLVAALVAGILLGSIEALVFCSGALFEHEFDEKVYFYIFYFCASTVFPILYFTGIPSIEECHEETPTLNKFATSTIRFLFFPVLSLAILLFYAYIVKFIALWDMPQGMVSYFVTGFMVYMLALVTIMYPTRLGTGQSFEKKLLKIFPTACIPLVVMMSVGLMRRISEYGISELRIYAVVVNIFFFAIIAILLIDKIKCKSRYIAVIFCALLFIFMVSPLKASKITRHVWMENLKSALVAQGYTEFPLSKEDTRQFIWDLRQKGDKESALLVSRISELTRIPDKDIAEYINITRFDDAFINSLGSKKCCGEVEDEDSEPFDTFNISVEYPEKMAVDIPHGAKQAVNIEHLFDDNEFEFQGDTLTFRISLDDIYTFTVDRRTLKQDTTKSIKSDRATLAISNLHAAEWSPTSRILRITGILFIE